MAPKYVFSNDGQGMGGFLCPPGHPNLHYTVKEYYGGRMKKEPDGLRSVESVADDDSVPGPIRVHARRILKDAVLVESENWMREVYGYFRHMYSPDGVDRNVSNLTNDPTDELPPGRHAGYLTVREYFPDHEPRVDLVRGGGKYGSWPCCKCSQTVQYEPRIDAFAVFGKEHAGCPEGGNHEKTTDE